MSNVLDIAGLRKSFGGLVVAEWIRGGSLQEVADTSPSAVGAARAMQTLAAAAEAASRDVRSPNSSRENRSLPRSSVPSKCPRLTPALIASRS